MKGVCVEHARYAQPRRVISSGDFDRHPDCDPQSSLFARWCIFMHLKKGQFLPKFALLSGGNA